MPEKTPTQSKILNTIINQIAAEKGDQLTVETRQALRERLLDLIEENMIAALPDEKLVELDKMTEQGMTDEELQKFLDEAGVDFTKAAEEAVEMFREAYLTADTSMDDLPVADVEESEEE